MSHRPMLMLKIPSLKLVKMFRHGEAPRYRSSHAMVVVDDKILILGGYSFGHMKSTVEYIDLALGDWGVFETDGPRIWTPGCSADYCSHWHEVLVYGVSSGNAETRALILNVGGATGGVWEILQTTGEPPLCKGHRSLIRRSTLFIYGGGYSSQGYQRDWIYLLSRRDSRHGCWSRVTMNGAPKTVESLTNFSMCTCNGHFVIFGGADSIDPLCTYDPASNLWKTIQIPEDTNQVDAEDDDAIDFQNSILAIEYTHHQAVSFNGGVLLIGGSFGMKWRELQLNL